MTLPQDIVARLRAAQAEPFVTRFAPSPTGYLHLGHVVSALFVWGIGRALGARIILRVEDHDRTRCRPVYEKALFDDLAWLGFEADATFRQSDDETMYEDAIATWRRYPGVYACACSRKDIQLRSPASGNEDELRYDGWCRQRGHTPGPGRGLRLVMGPEEVAFTDLWLGGRAQNPSEQCGDTLLKDRDGYYTYQCAVVADDVRQGVNLVIRGQDLTASTGRQILMGRWLGRKKDAFFLHHPLAQDSSGRKLAKRDFSEAIGKRRAQGESAAKLLGESAHAAGLLSAPAPLSLAECMELF